MVRKETGEVGKHSRQRELFRSLAKQEKGSNSPVPDPSEDRLASEGSDQRTLGLTNLLVGFPVKTSATGETKKDRQSLCTKVFIT